MSLQVTVCVCTFRRPHLLPGLLDSLARQQSTGLNWSVVIVDNDEAGSAEATVRARATTFPVPLVYVIEPRRGIAHARNTAVAHSVGDYVAFIDDDEAAEPLWLAELARVAVETQADAVLGPVLPTFPPGSAAWASKCGLYDRPRHATGTRVAANEGRTGNTLIKRTHLVGGGDAFDPTFGLAGGEDYDFFRRLDAKGGVIRWADSAIVSESVQLNRQRIAWIVERSLHGATGYWRQQNRIAPVGMPLARAAAGLTLSLVLGLVALLIWPFSTARAVKALSLSAKCAGRLLALTSVRIEAYRRA